MGGSPSRSATAPGIGAQTTPEVCRTVHASHSVVERLGREDDVALVLAVLVVGDQHRPAARARAAERRLHRGQGAHAVTSLGSRLGRLGAGDPQPDDEAVEHQTRVHGVQHGRGVEAGVHQQRHADEVDRDPGEPEVVPAARHRVGRDDRADEDPGVAPEVPPRRRPPRTDHGEQPLHDAPHRRPRSRGTARAPASWPTAGVIAGTSAPAPPRSLRIWSQRHHP